MGMRGRHGLATVGVALLMAVVLDAPASRAAEQTGTPWLGVYSQDLTPELSEGMNHGGEGVLVTRVVSDSPADKAGIRKGDVIVRVNSRLVDSPGELTRIVRAGHVGDQVSIQIERDGNRQTLNARLAARDEGEDSEAPEAESGHSHDHDPDLDFDYDDNGPDSESFDIPDDAFTMIGGGRGRLGVTIQSLNPGLGDYFGVKDGKGVLVLDVVEDSPAEHAGVKAGDVIVRLGDRDVNDADDLIRAIRSKEGKVAVVVVRHNVRKSLEAELRASQLPRVMRLRSGSGRLPRTWSWSTTDRDDVRRELRELREEMRELKRDLEELRKR